MNRSFLIGRFLPSHAGGYRYQPRGAAAHLSAEQMAIGFTRRVQRFQRQQRRYVTLMQFAVVLAMLVVIGAFNLDFRPKQSKPVYDLRQELVTMQEVIQTRQLVKPPPPPRPPVPVEVPNDEILDDEPLDLDASLTLEPIFAAAPPPPPAEKERAYEEVEIFEFVETMPTIVGGQAALAAKLNYPMAAQRAGIDGMVIVRVVIQPDGTPEDPTLIREAHDLLNQEALRAVMELEYSPGLQRGRAVPVMLAVPVRFRLTD
ncbi:MAG: energy transducer TonB [Bacteroidota bacterium]|nr:energy transducer TonB [Bacteroidota bacterium]